MQIAIGFVAGVVVGHFYPQIFQALKGLYEKIRGQIDQAQDKTPKE